mmetsp:Transcript_18498/g.20569  ORF Transcript_18498/g.20569 Transcript_18498/m.20569 type:complete len:106 (-) Transcript_18498:75-392(-)|eukprot:CAMPEP_0168508916 /NCGR_PEP_ID=MMETSP0405-20121227/424_1 /TAXON_ID=498012 /ORGANISM="Trichosphaerium sp, Strain Am-I-7 wt" /LENGTH=105 /DNA_ID=CAMNT_0008526193 /DNA_START=73 /DNA_END=390 /DNA_ORIENTATION=+
MSRCTFCKNSICFGEVMVDGKPYHEKCTRNARGVDVEAIKAEARAKSEAKKREREAEMARLPKTIEVGEIRIEGAGQVYNHKTGKLEPSKGRFANPRVGVNLAPK